MDYSGEGMKMIIYVVSGRGNCEEKCMDERIKFKQEIKNNYIIDFVGYF